VLWLADQQVDLQALFDLMLAKDYIVFAGAKFDCKMFLSTFGWYPENLRDVIIMGKMISNATGSKVGKGHGHSYADLCREYLSVHLTGKNTLRKSTWGIGLEGRNLESEEWYQKVLYAANDVQYLLPINDLMETTLCTPLPDTTLTNSGNTTSDWGLGLREMMDLEHSFIPVVVDLEYTGMPTNLNIMNKFQAGIVQELDSLGVYLSEQLGLDAAQSNWLGQLAPSPKATKLLRSSGGLLELTKKAVGMSKLDNMQGAVLTRMLQLIDLLSQMDSNNPEALTAADIFVDADEADLFQELTELEHGSLVANAPLIQAILNYKKMSKQSSMDLRKYINVSTQCIHSSLDQLGAATSRSSSSAPNCQQVSGRTTAVCDIEFEDFKAQ
jgi:DNA polymerase I-like protein with 3'-5' exonuclease and polymerase domains